MNCWREVARFASVFEAFNAYFHAYLWASDTSLPAFGITMTPPWSGASATVHAVFAILPSAYGWRRKLR